MTTHLMIVHPQYIAPILSGTKCVEARLGTDRRAPYNKVQPGDTVYIKPSGQRVIGKAVVHRVDQYDDLTPELIDELREVYNDRVKGPDSYWDAKADAKHATFITLEDPAMLRDEQGVPEELLVASRSAWRCTEQERRVRKAA